MYIDLENTIIDITNEKYKDFPSFLDGNLFLEYDNGFVTQEQESIEAKVKKYIAFLSKTDFKFSDDYDLKDTPEWLELKAKRQECREFIRANNG